MRRGLFAALLFAAVLVGSCGVLVESALMAHAPVSRYASADAVVHGRQSVSLEIKRAGSKPKTESRPLTERVRLPLSTGDRLRAVPGVHKVVPTITKPGYADAFAVYGDVSEVRRAVPGLAVATGAARGDVEDLKVAAVRPDIIEMTASLGGVALMIAMIVIGGQLALSVRRRGREYALLRAVGATPRQVLGRVVRETTRLAVPAGVMGGLLSLGVGAATHRMMIDKGALPHGFGLSLTPLPAVAAALVTVLVAALSGLLAAARVARIKPVRALGEAELEPAELPRWRVITGVLCLVVGLNALGLSMAVGGQAAAASVGGVVVSLIVATALLGPLLARYGARAVRGRSAGGVLATRNSLAAAGRMAAAITPVALFVAFAGVQLFAQSTIAHATHVQVSDGYRGVGAVPPGTPGATAVKHTTVVMSLDDLGEKELTSLPAQGVTPDPRMDPGITSGSLRDLRGDTIAVSSRVGGKVGSTKRLWLGDGTPIRPRVVAVYDRGLGFGDVLLPHDVVTAHTTSPDDDYALAPGGTPLTDRQDAETRLAGFMTYVVVAIIAGFIAIGVVTVLAVATAGRRREFTLLRRIGATRRQIMRMLRVEALIALATGITIGGLIVTVTLFAFAAAVTGLPVPSVPPLPAAGLLLFVITIGSAAILLPGRYLLKGRS